MQDDQELMEYAVLNGVTSGEVLLTVLGFGLRSRPVRGTSFLMGDQEWGWTNTRVRHIFQRFTTSHCSAPKLPERREAGSGYRLWTDLCVTTAAAWKWSARLGGDRVLYDRGSVLCGRERE